MSGELIETDSDTRRSSITDAYPARAIGLHNPPVESGVEPGGMENGFCAGKGLIVALIKQIRDFKLQVPIHFLHHFDSTPDQDRFWGAAFKIDADIAPLFPFLNGAVESAVYYENPEHLRLTLEERRCHLFPRSISTYLFEDRQQARRFADRLVALINDVHDRREQIEPNYEKLRPTSIVDLLRILPRTNCGDCGHPTCQAFAVALNQKQAAPEDCPALAAPLAIQAVYPVLDENGTIRSTVTVDTALTNRQAARTPPSTAPDPSPESRPPVPDHVDPRYRHEANFGLSDREVDVLRQVARGSTNVEIAAALGISPHTVKSHVIHIFNKFGVNDRTQAAVLATRHGII